MKSPFDKSKINEDDLKGLFKITLEQARAEGTFLWHSFSAFLIANSILVGFIAQMLFTEKNDGSNKNIIYILSGVGILICVLWFGTYRRRSKNYHFRMAQARQREPEGWHLIAGDGYQFSEGEIIEIRNPENKKVEWERYDRGRGFLSFFDSKICMSILISFFFVAYILILFFFHR